jgi:hypothetical protein
LGSAKTEGATFIICFPLDSTISIVTVSPFLSAVNTTLPVVASTVVTYIELNTEFEDETEANNAQNNLTDTNDTNTGIEVSVSRVEETQTQSFVFEGGSLKLSDLFLFFKFNYGEVGVPFSFYRRSS